MATMKSTKLVVRFSQKQKTEFTLESSQGVLAQLMKQKSTTHKATAATIVQTPAILLKSAALFDPVS